MVNKHTDPLSSTFQALADPTRRAILARLALGEATVCEVARPFNISLPAVSRHLSVLEAAGLVQRERDGRLRRCHLDPRPMQDVADWIGHYRRFWEARFDQLEQYLSEINTTDPNFQEKTDGPGTAKQ